MGEVTEKKHPKVCRFWWNCQICTNINTFENIWCQIGANFLGGGGKYPMLPCGTATANILSGGGRRALVSTTIEILDANPLHGTIENGQNKSFQLSISS